MRLTRQDIKGMALDFLEILRHREINDLIDLDPITQTTQLISDNYSSNGCVMIARETGEPEMQYRDIKLPGIIPISAIPSKRAYSSVVVLCGEDITGYNLIRNPDKDENATYERLLPPNDFSLVISELQRLSRLED